MDVALVPSQVAKYNLTKKIAVVIDVLRFSTSVSAAFQAGAEAFYPVEDPSQAFALKKEDPNLLLAGERRALKIPGFDFGNSPLEHLQEDHRGKRIVFCTTNGTRAVHLGAKAKKVVLASIRTARAVAQFLKAEGQEVLFIPAGTGGRFSLEDIWCAGQILSHLPGPSFGDGARAAQAIFEAISLSELENSEHARNLVRLGFQNDLSYCLKKDADSNVVLWDSKSGWGRLA
ncbi:MAG: 2-phosphosulfolactate phosphatase [Firmicutes bacterium]|nr:2-phosphosulfolactate phosphatase [Bacillota bacterium]